jgi:hypothetical protein
MEGLEAHLAQFLSWRQELNDLDENKVGIVFILNGMLTDLSGMPG